MKAISPWLTASAAALAESDVPAVYEKSSRSFSIVVHCTQDSLWISTYWVKGGNISFRAAYAPGQELKIINTEKKPDGIHISLKAAMGQLSVNIHFFDGDYPILRYTTSLKPSTALHIPFWPRDIVMTDKHGHAEKTSGQVYVSQVGTRTGMLYMGINKPVSGALLYLQNLSALNEYCSLTKTSAGGTVGGQWPELGFTLPVTKDDPLPAGKAITIGDAFVCFDDQFPKDEAAVVRQYLQLLSEIYLHLPHPHTVYQDWPVILDNGLRDLIESPGCWSQVKGHAYFNAYVCDYITPPEIMVQLAVLLPLIDYMEWSKNQLAITQKILDNLPTFYDQNLKTIMRWLPAAADKLEGEEEQKKPMVMDSWYLHHPLLNLSRMALKGDKVCAQLFLDSVEYAIKVARHFKYRWPVFYHMETLEVIKAETSAGKGGEKDVAGLYTHIMLQAWELTGKKRFLEEAKKAALTLKGLGFDLFYQANNTAFSAGALLRLYKITKNKTYLDLSYLCLANIFKNVQLWECQYGYGRHFPSFFALFPLNDAPYTAVYEEQEVFCAFHDFLKYAQGESIHPPVILLITEYIRYLVNRAVYYYPTMLPKEMLAEKPKVGELDPKLWIALEDMHDGWEKCGSVGQEVYGAGNAFGILPRHYLIVPEANFMLYSDYPVADFSLKRDKTASFSIIGDERLSCRMVIVPAKNEKLPEFSVSARNRKTKLDGQTATDGRLEFTVQGNDKVQVKWR